MRSIKLRGFALIVPLLCLQFLTPRAADAGVRFSLVGVGTYDGFKSAGVTSTPKLGIGYGALLEIGFGPKLGIELGGLSIVRKDVTDGTTYSVPIWEFPLVLRLWPVRFLSIGGGLYYGTAINKTITKDDGSGPVQSDYATEGLKTTDFGAVGLLGLNIPLFSVVRLLVEGRYTFGLYNVSVDTSVTAKYDDAQVLAGIRIGI